MITTLTTLTKRTVSLVPKDDNGNIVPLAGTPTITADHPEFVLVDRIVVDNGAGPRFIQFDISGVGAGTANINVNATPSVFGAAFDFAAVTVNVAIDPRVPGPATHFDVTVSDPPVDK